MKLKTKVFIVFISSLILSVIIFLFTVWYLMSHGSWSGITMYDMERVTKQTAENIATVKNWDEKSLDSIFEMQKKNNPNMEFELFSTEKGILYATSKSHRITDLESLVTDLSQNGRKSQKDWVLAQTVTHKKYGKVIVIVIVPSKFYSAVTYRINAVNGYGVFGKMFLIGIIITLVVTSSVAYFFTRKLSRQFKQLLSSIEAFDMGNLNVELQGDSKDEIGRLATTFNNMAGRLKKQIETEKTYEEERKKLVSDISHDLRTPLTSIVGYAETLDDKVYDNEDEMRKYISIIRKKSVYMEKLLKELLEFSRLETGGYKINKQSADISELMREILIEYLPLFEKEDIELATDIPDTMQKINVDRDLISRVLRNLLDNAVKYGKSGKRIDVSMIDEEAHQLIKIRDCGPGVPDDNMSMIFNRFYRGDKSRSAQDGGMGLGLAISYEMIKLNGGNIKAENCPDHGVAFVVRLLKPVLKAAGDI